MLHNPKAIAYLLLTALTNQRLLILFILLLVALLFPSLVLAEGSPGNTICPGC